MGRLINSIKQKPSRPTVAQMREFNPVFFLLLGIAGMIALIVIYASAASQPEAITGNRDADGQRLSLEENGGLPAGSSVPVRNFAFNLLDGTSSGASLALTQQGDTTRAEITPGTYVLPETEVRALLDEGACDTPAGKSADIGVVGSAGLTATIQQSISSLIDGKHIITLVTGSGDQTSRLACALLAQ